MVNYEVYEIFLVSKRIEYFKVMIFKFSEDILVDSTVCVFMNFITRALDQCLIFKKLKYILI